MPQHAHSSQIVIFLILVSLNAVWCTSFTTDIKSGPGKHRYQSGLASLQPFLKIPAQQTGDESGVGGVERENTSPADRSASSALRPFGAVFLFHFHKQTRFGRFIAFGVGCVPKSAKT